MADYISPNLGLTFLSETQAGKATSINEALLRLDTAVQLSVLHATLTVPPVSPGEGDRYVVAVGGTGAWAGHDNAVAGYYGGWRFVLPAPGWTAWDQSTGAFTHWDGASWLPGAANSSTLDKLADVDVSGGKTAGQVLTWHADTMRWMPSTPAAASGTAVPPSLATCTDVTLTPAPTTGQVLAWDATASKARFVTPAAGGGGGTGPALTPPHAADFAWIDGTGGSKSDGPDATWITFPVQDGSANRCEAIIQAVPATPYQVTMKVRRDAYSIKYCNEGPGWYNSTSGQIAHAGHGIVSASDSSGMSYSMWNNKNSFSTSDTTFLLDAVELYWRISDDGTLRRIDFSRDGFRWTTFRQVGHAEFLTPTHIGVMANLQELSLTLPHRVSVLHWSVSSIILPATA